MSLLQGRFFLAILFKTFAFHKVSHNLFLLPFWNFIDKKITADGSMDWSTSYVEFTSLAGNAFVMDCQVGDPGHICDPAARREDIAAT